MHMHSRGKDSYFSFKFASGNSWKSTMMHLTSRSLITALLVFVYSNYSTASTDKDTDTLWSSPSWSIPEDVGLSAYNTRDLYAEHNSPDVSAGAFDTPEGRHLHKAKKLKKKLLLLCLLGGGGGRQARSVQSAEGRLFFPVIQHTDVSVGGSGVHDEQEHEGQEHGSSGGFDCNKILSSGGAGVSSHPLLASIGGLLGGGNQGSSADDTRFHRQLNKNVIRPLYKSMRRMSRYFK